MNYPPKHRAASPSFPLAFPPYPIPAVRLSRRRALPLLALAATTPFFIRTATSADAPQPPLESFDHEMREFMTAREIPGGALAIVRNRKLIYARGYGRADRDSPAPVAPDSLFRIASISKPFTAVAILKLVEQGKLNLDDHALARLPLKPFLAADANADERLAQITVRQLLHHTAGWDREKSYDPMFRAKQIARDLGVAPPASARDVIRHHLGQPLDFAPGTRYAYSNFGYCVLGRLLEELSGESYEAFTRRAVLTPAGIRKMRLGKSLLADRAESEVRYHTPDNARGESVFTRENTRVPLPYGGFALEAMDAHGGWLASIVDLARFAAALDESAPQPLLARDAWRTLHEPPPAPVSRKDDGSLKPFYYACGWMARPVGDTGKANYWHAGSLPGGHSLLVRRWDGISWAVLFNQRSNHSEKPDSAIDPALHRAAAAVKAWPTEDLFPRFDA